MVLVGALVHLLFHTFSPVFAFESDGSNRTEPEGPAPIRPGMNSHQKVQEAIVSEFNNLLSSQMTDAWPLLLGRLGSAYG